MRKSHVNIVSPVDVRILFANTFSPFPRTFREAVMLISNYPQTIGAGASFTLAHPKNGG